MAATLQLETIALEGWPRHLTGPVDILPRGGGLGPPVVWQVVTPAAKFALRKWQLDQRSQALRVTSLLRHVDRRRPGWVAVPQLSATGETLFEAADTLWELAPWLPGVADFAQAPSLDRVASAARTLAELHSTLHDLTHDGPRLGPASGTAEEQLSRVQQLLDSGQLAEATPLMLKWGWPEHFPQVERALRAGCDMARGLLQPLQGQQLPRQWCWGDAWHRNMLFEGERVTGLVDFGTARVDVAMADLARLLGSTCAYHPVWRRAALEAYDAVCPLGNLELVAATALQGCATVVSLANWCRWLAIENQTVAHPQEVCDRVEHFVGRLRGLLDR